MAVVEAETETVAAATMSASTAGVVFMAAREVNDFEFSNGPVPEACRWVCPRY